MKATFSLTLTALLAGLALVSCKSLDSTIAPDASPEIYFQKAQAASDVNDYKGALVIYQKFLATGQDDDQHHRISAQYEVALLALKLGNSADAENQFKALLDQYSDATKAAEYPTWIKVLATKKIQEIEDAKAKNPAPAPAVTAPAPAAPAP